jgi:signal transduction histidine kinase
VKYGSAGTPIVLDVAVVDDEVVVAVTNEGGGISEGELPLLFRRFQRASGAKSAKIKGTGLGLYITRELVEAHGGRITVASTPGERTTFRFTLPRERP